jgi:ankyrin repeat protein
MSCMTNESESDPLKMNIFDLCKNDQYLNELKERINKNQTDDNNLINSIDNDESKMTMLMWACDCGSLEIVKYLIDSGADTNLRDSTGQTCLHLAVFSEHEQIIELLIKTKSIDINIEDEDGQKPIDITDNENIKKLLR